MRTLAVFDPPITYFDPVRTRLSTSDGPWLFGAFSVADGMYAPVACRFHIYNVPLPPVATEYRDTLLAHPAMREWHEAALKETEAHAHYDGLAKEYGGGR